MELTRDELLKKLNISKNNLHEWLENDLLSPKPGISHVFPEQAVEEGALIKQFLELGYSLNEIRHAASPARESRTVRRISWGSLAREGVAYSMSRNKIRLRGRFFLE